MEVWKCSDEEGLKWIIELFDVIFRTAKMTREWRFSTIIPLYKNNGNVWYCNNYRGTKLLNHTKLWERVIEITLQKDTCIS